MTQTIAIDFLAPPAAPAMRLAGWALLAVAIGVALLAAERHEALRLAIDEAADRRERLATRNALAARDRGAAPAEAADAAAAKARWQRARAVIEPLSVPWASLFVALEAAAGAGITLEALEPAPEAAKVRIAGQAGTLDAALAYTRRLAAQPGWQRVHLVRYATPSADAAAASAPAAAAAGPRIDFGVEASWSRP
jgi:hypothetical protein